MREGGRQRREEGGRTREEDGREQQGGFEKSGEGSDLWKNEAEDLIVIIDRGAVCVPGQYVVNEQLHRSIACPPVSLAVLPGLGLDLLALVKELSKSTKLELRRTWRRMRAENREQ